jgi:pimeloyl-ACP methyl ester carboxylesterase
MTTRYTHDTVPTEFVEAAGIRFAYRRFGAPGTRPVIFFQCFRGTMDTYDPAITDALAAEQEVILFNNAGVGSSDGPPAETVVQLAADAATFIDALGVTEADFLGHSMGGEVAQMVTFARPELVRRLVLVGTGPRGGEGMSRQKPTTAGFFAETYDRWDDMWLPIFFSPSAAGQLAGRKYLERTRTREDRDLPVSTETAKAHRVAATEWGQPADPEFGYLSAIDQPTLVVNGSNDIVIATVNSFILQQHMPNAQLIVYPDANHGAHFQYPDMFIEHVRMFLR